MFSTNGFELHVCPSYYMDSAVIIGASLSEPHINGLSMVYRTYVSHTSISATGVPGTIIFACTYLHHTHCVAQGKIWLLPLTNVAEFLCGALQ